jgi:hypothetical protein
MVHGLAGGQRHAIPHHAAIRLRHQKRALSDRKTRIDAETGNAEIVAPDELVIFRQFLAREPRLALPVHELPFVHADQARMWRLGVFGKLGSTLFARP